MIDFTKTTKEVKVNEPVIDLVRMFRPESVRGAKINWESKEFINVGFYVQGYNLKWYRIKSLTISKNSIEGY